MEDIRISGDRIRRKIGLEFWMRLSDFGIEKEGVSDIMKLSKIHSTNQKGKVET